MRDQTRHTHRQHNEKNVTADKRADGCVPLHAEPQKRWFACDRSHAVLLPPEEKLINSNSGLGNSKSSKDENEITF